MTVKRRIFIALMSMGALLAGCTASVPDGEAIEPAGSTSPAPANSATLGLTYIPNVQFAPAYVAKEDGAFSRENVSVTIRHHGADEGLFTSLLAGHEDMVIATGDEMIQARSQGMDLISVGSYYAKYPVVIIVKDDSDIQSVADLKGKTVGLPGEYGSNYFGLLAALAEADMTRDDISISVIGFTQLAALAGDQVDAVVGFTNNDTVQFGLSNIPVREIPLVADGEPPLVGADIVTTTEFARSHPEAVRGVLSGLKAGMTTCVTDPAHAVDVTRAYDTNLTTEDTVNAARATLEATNQLFAPSGQVELHQNVETWKSMEVFLRAIDGVLGAAVDIEQAVTNEYLD
ncbi:MAG: ABC transporter substrate-binding protein [Actinomycetaceae bacterium]|nr:ABC transporter substrate-binding protein [Actinomycetaceae bacterium]